MLSIAIYSENESLINELKSCIQDFLIREKVMAKVSYFNDTETFITVPSSYDFYLIDLDSEKNNLLEVGKQMMSIDAGSYFTFLSSDKETACPAAKARVDYYMLKPLDLQELNEILLEVKQEIKEKNIIIKIPQGERRIKINTLNYVNIIKRCLCYHLKDGNMFDGQTLRTSFEKAIDPLQYHPSFLFLAPSLLINLGEIKIVNADHLIFENDDILYFPKKAHDTVIERWKNYNKI